MNKATHKRIATEHIDGAEFGLEYTDGNYKIIRCEGKYNYTKTLDTKDEAEALAKFELFVHN